MDIYVQPSLNEGMGKTLVQAHTLKLPIVATTVQGIPDIVLDGKTGLLVPPGDPQALAEAVAGLAKDSNARRAMGEAGCASVNRKINGLPCFGADRMVALFEKLYEDILKN
jgi:L-malate glycosyltransferase